MGTRALPTLKHYWIEWIYCIYRSHQGQSSASVCVNEQVLLCALQCMFLFGDFSTFHFASFIRFRFTRAHRWLSSFLFFHGRLVYEYMTLYMLFGLTFIFNVFHFATSIYLIFKWCEFFSSPSLSLFSHPHAIFPYFLFAMLLFAIFFFVSLLKKNELCSCPLAVHIYIHIYTRIYQRCTDDVIIMYATTL